MVKTGIPIWGAQIPGNNSSSKLEILDVGSRRPDLWMVIQAAKYMIGTEPGNLDKAKRRLDTYQYYHEIATGFRPETFEDVPCIDYYPCEGADAALLIIPGGGFTYQSNSGVAPEKQYEGGILATKLNAAGYAAFVLSCYRIDPYRMPIPLLDAQRAIRYIRYHATDFGIDPDKVGISGFSAGGFLSVGVINILRNRSVCEILQDAGMTEISYTADEVDQMEAKCAFAGLFYGMLSFSGTQPAMSAAFPMEEIRDAASRNALIRKYDAVSYVQRGDIPQFIMLGTRDNAVDETDDKTRYMAELEKNGVPYKYLPIPGAKHGFGAKDGKYGWWVEKFIDWIKGLD